MGGEEVALCQRENMEENYPLRETTCAKLQRHKAQGM